MSGRTTKTRASWPVATVAVGPVSCGNLLWRTKGRLHVTAVVKSSFELVADGLMAVTAAEPLDAAAGELAPYLGQADVVMRAGQVHAVPPRAVSALSLRLAVVRDWPVVDKKLLVYPRGQVGAARSPVVVERLSLSGDGPQAGLLVNPADPSRPARVQAMGAGSPARLAVLGGGAAPRMNGQVVEIEDMFPWSYYQTAPPDQRTDHLRGDEWVVLEGLHPRLSRWSSRLPGAVAQAMVYPPDLNPAGAHPVAMLADMLMIDPDRGRCSVVWRGSFPVRDEASARGIVLVAGLAWPGQAVAWPDQASLAGSPMIGRGHGLAQTTEREDEDSLAETLAVDRPFTPETLNEMAQSGTHVPIDGTVVARERLELTADGEVGLIELSDEDILGVAPDGLEAETVALSARESEQMRSALGLPPTAKAMLRPAQIVGLPWTDDQPPREAGPPPPVDDDTPELEAYTIDSLELTLSESLEAHGFGSVAELQADIAGRFREGSEPPAK